MGIEKGRDWGIPGVLPDAAPIARSDRQAAALLGQHEVIGLGEGDLARTLGIGPSYDRAGTKQLVPVDSLEIELDSGERHACLAHAVAGSMLYSGHVVAVMNAAFVGRLNVAPRAHPGDGKADVVTMRLRFADRVKAYRRMPTGTHLPHPGIDVRRKVSGTLELGSAQSVRVDGKRVGRTATLRFRVVPNSVTIGVS